MDPIPLPVLCDMCARLYAVDIVYDTHKGSRFVSGWQGGNLRRCRLCAGCFAEDRELRKTFGQVPYGEQV